MLPDFGALLCGNGVTGIEVFAKGVLLDYGALFRVCPHSCHLIVGIYQTKPGASQKVVDKVVNNVLEVHVPFGQAVEGQEGHSTCAHVGKLDDSLTGVRVNRFDPEASTGAWTVSAADGI